MPEDEVTSSVVVHFETLVAAVVLLALVAIFVGRRLDRW